MGLWIARHCKSAIVALFGLAASGCGSDDVVGVTVGQLQVVIATTGSDLDNLYELVVGNVHRSVSANVTMLFNLQPGTYQVSLTNVATNCILNGGSTQSVTVTRAEVTVAQFSLDCAVTGIEIRTQTTGPDNPDSYTAQVGTTYVLVPVNGVSTVSRLQPATYSVSLQFPGENCTVVGDRNLTATVQNRAVAKISFDVACVPPVRTERIAFVEYSSGGEDQWQLILANPDGSQTRTLWNGVSPAWSPDGKKLAFVRQTCSYYYGCYGSLVVGDPEAQNTLVLRNASFGASIGSPAWSPAGDLIAFSASTAFGLPSHLFTMGVDGSSLTAIGGDNILEALHPAWSPQGDRIAFTCVVGVAGNFDICAINRNSTGGARLTSNGYSESDPSWSPNGARIVYTVFSGEFDSRIATMAADGSDQVILSNGFSPSWSADGSRIIFARSNGIYTMKPDGTDVNRLTTGRHRDPAWRRL